MKQSVLLALSMLAMPGAVTGWAQTTAPHREVRRLHTVPEGEPFLLKELGAVVVPDTGALKVVTIMPPAQRPAAYKDVDLQGDDVIAMANGRRITTVKDLQRLYDSLAVGSLLKLGVRRGGEMHMVSLVKGDPKGLPQLKMKIMHRGDGEETFPAVGVSIKVNDKSLVIDELLPGETPVKTLDVKPGDIITSINGTPVSSLKEYEDVFDNLAPGREVTWSLARGESRHSVTFLKPKPRMIIRREGAGK